jgi:hypothetical protein
MEPGLLRVRERKEGCRMAFTATSPAFRNGSAVPKQFTCDGSDTPPPLEVSGAPEGTRSFAVIMDDPDAPNGIHPLAGIRRSGGHGRAGGRSRQDAPQRLRPRSRVACDPTKQCWIGGPLERTARRPVPTVRSRSASLQLHCLRCGRTFVGSAGCRKKGPRTHVENAHARYCAINR